MSASPRIVSERERDGVCVECVSVVYKERERERETFEVLEKRESRVLVVCVCV